MKLPIFILVSALMMAPSSVFSMDTTTDISSDLNMTNIAWANYDRGTLILSTIRRLYKPGHLNTNNHHADGLYIDMDTETIGVAEDSKGLFSNTISGILLRTHAYAGGDESVNLSPVRQFMTLNPNHRVLVIIRAH